MNVFERWLLRRLLRKPAPNIIPRNGKEALSIDCNVIYLRATNGEATLLVRGINDKSIFGKIWLNGEEAEEFFLPYFLIGDYSIDITHFYGVYDLTYKSFLQYFLKGFFVWIV